MNILRVNLLRCDLVDQSTKNFEIVLTLPIDKLCNMGYDWLDLYDKKCLHRLVTGPTSRSWAVCDRMGYTDTL